VITRRRYQYIWRPLLTVDLQQEFDEGEGQQPSSLSCAQSNQVFQTAPPKKMPPTFALGWYDVTEFDFLNDKWTAEANSAGCQHKLRLTATLGSHDGCEGSSLCFSVTTETNVSTPLLLVDLGKAYSRNGHDVADFRRNYFPFLMGVWDWLHDKTGNDDSRLAACVFRHLKGTRLKHEPNADGVCQYRLLETERKVVEWTPEEVQESTCSEESRHGSSFDPNQAGSDGNTCANSLDLGGRTPGWLGESRVSSGDESSVSLPGRTLKDMAGSIFQSVREWTTDVWNNLSFQRSNRDMQDGIRV
jgi:hypothetical protein